MGAKDTVMRPSELDKLAEKYPLLDFSFEDDYREEVKLMREAQAEISFKAGEKHALEGAVMGGGYESVKKVGIRAVVEELNKLEAEFEVSTFREVITSPLWHAKLEEDKQ